MLSKIISALTPKTHSVNELSKVRAESMTEAYGSPHQINEDRDSSHKIDIYVFERNFIEECDTDSEDNEGYILVTSGMSDRLMTLNESNDDESPAAELIWYTRELNPEYFSNLRWLAKLPFIDNTWYGFGHTVSLPEPPLSCTSFNTFLLLPPIIQTDRHLFDNIAQQGHPIETYSVHLLSDQEYRLTNTEDGLDHFLDLLDEKEYPVIFDPSRQSYI